MDKSTERKIKMHCSATIRYTLAAIICTSCITLPLAAKDQPQWGQSCRNMVSSENNIPATFNPKTGLNIKWSVPLGTQSYSTPVVANGKVFVGTNNDKPRDRRHKGDRGILLCLDETDGSLIWQLVTPKLQGDIYLDWPRGGIYSPATVEGDRVYVVGNRAEIFCLDINGQHNGNDGRFKEEGTIMVLPGDDPIEVTSLDADVIWSLDMKTDPVNMYPHDSAHSSILIDGDLLYLNTGNGVDNTHRKIRRPDAPSLIVVDKKTGRLVAQDDERIGNRIVHSTWSSPCLADINNQKQILFGGGNGVCYGFKAPDKLPLEQSRQFLERIWYFNCDTNSPKGDPHDYMRNRKVSASNIKGMPVFYKNRVYVAAGGDIWWGKTEAWLKCIDATQTGDITDTGLIWSYDLEKHCSSTPSVYNDMVFIADCDGLVHCIDTRTGKAHWTHDTGGEIWASTLVVDGKVFIGNRRKKVFIFEAKKQKKVLAVIKLDAPIDASPTAANNTIYIATHRTLYAIATSMK
jgi:outer membrane protein assembly factor BamB